MHEALLLDVDNTLTPPRRPLDAAMAEVLKALRVPFCLVAGSDLALIRGQLLEPLHGFGYRGEFDAYLCNGSTWYRCRLAEDLQVELVEQFFFDRHLGGERFRRLKDRIERVLDSEDFRLPTELSVIGERLVDRGSMLNVAPIGRPSGKLSDRAYRNRELFCSFDEATGFRRRLIDRMRAELADLLEGTDLRISLGGQTSLDFNVEGYDKSFPIPILLQAGFTKLTYLGDALFEGGNDEAILRFISNWPNLAADYPQFVDCPISAVRVDSHKHTEELLCRLGFAQLEVPVA